MSPGSLALTVIVPAHNALRTLRPCLEALVASDLPRERFELILVDDASTDETSVLGAEYCDTVVRLSGRPHGPAYARNRGFETSRGRVIVFVDADVTVHPDALRRIVERYTADAEIDALFGSYDDRPAAPGFVSQYRNLMHHFVHQQGAGEATTFWAGLGSVKREVFAEAGMFDEWHYNRPQIEDIELGRRLHGLGHRIVLDPAIQGTHHKAWTLRSTFAADFQHRGVPWMWLLLQEGDPGKQKSLNLKVREKVLTALAGLSLTTPVAALVLRDARPMVLAALVAALILIVNLPFYFFLSRVRNPLFALAVMPLHLTYYALNAVSVVIGWLVHIMLGEPIPPAAMSAHAQIGIATWPPAPRRSSQSIWEKPPGEQGRSS